MHLFFMEKIKKITCLSQNFQHHSFVPEKYRILLSIFILILKHNPYRDFIVNVSVYFSKLVEVLDRFNQCNNLAYRVEYKGFANKYVCIRRLPNCK